MKRDLNYRHVLYIQLNQDCNLSVCERFKIVLSFRSVSRKGYLSFYHAKLEAIDEASVLQRSMVSRPIHPPAAQFLAPRCGNRPWNASPLSWAPPRQPS